MTMRATDAQHRSGEMISALTRHAVQVLLGAGHTQADVAERAGVSIATVRRIAEEPDIDRMDEGAERVGRALGRPSKAAPFASKVRAWLADDASLPTQELLRRAKEIGYGGSKTAFYALVAGLRPRRTTPIVRFEGLPGEFSQHDFGEVVVTFVGGRTKRIRFFASRLKYSRYVAVTLIEDQRVETLVRCLARDFASFGGLPLMAVFDRPRTIVKKGGTGRAVEEWNSTFAQAIVDIGVGVEMCAPRSGNQKGTVERLVGWVKSSFFKPRKFLDEADLRAQLEAWLVEVNTKTPSRATKAIPEKRRQEELARLRPIKVTADKLALRFPIFVGPTAEVMFEGVAYSMPPGATHVAGTLFLYEMRLRIVAGRFVADHRRRAKDEPKAPLPEHRAAKIAAVHGKRAKLYEKREHLLNLGGAALTLLTEITHRAPHLASRAVEELFTMLELHGDEAMREAVGAAVDTGQLTVAGVRRALASTARRSAAPRPREPRRPTLARATAAPCRSGSIACSARPTHARLSGAWSPRRRHPSAHRPHASCGGERRARQGRRSRRACERTLDAPEHPATFPRRDGRTPPRPRAARNQPTDERKRRRPRPPPQATAPRQRPSRLACTRRARRERAVDLHRVAAHAVRRGGRPSSRHPPRARRSGCRLSLPPHRGGVRLLLPVDPAPHHDRLAPRTRLRDRGTHRHLRRQARPRQDPPCHRHRVPSSAERL